MQFHNFTDSRQCFDVVLILRLILRDLLGQSDCSSSLLPETLRVKAIRKHARACHTFSGHLRHQQSSRHELHTALQLNSQEKPRSLSVMISLRSHPVNKRASSLPANLTYVYRIISGLLWKEMHRSKHNSLLRLRK